MPSNHLPYYVCHYPECTAVILNPYRHQLDKHADELTEEAKKWYTLEANRQESKICERRLKALSQVNKNKVANSPSYVERRPFPKHKNIIENMLDKPKTPKFSLPISLNIELSEKSVEQRPNEKKNSSSASVACVKNSKNVLSAQCNRAPSSSSSAVSCDSVANKMRSTYSIPSSYDSALTLSNPSLSGGSVSGSKKDSKQISDEPQSVLHVSDVMPAQQEISSSMGNINGLKQAPDSESCDILWSNVVSTVNKTHNSQIVITKENHHSPHAVGKQSTAVECKQEISESDHLIIANCSTSAKKSYSSNIKTESSDVDIEISHVNVSDTVKSKQITSIGSNAIASEHFVDSEIIEICASTQHDNSFTEQNCKISGIYSTCQMQQNEVHKIKSGVLHVKPKAKIDQNEPPIDKIVIPLDIKPIMSSGKRKSVDTYDSKEWFKSANSNSVETIDQHKNSRSQKRPNTEVRYSAPVIDVSGNDCSSVSSARIYSPDQLLSRMLLSESAVAALNLCRHGNCVSFSEASCVQEVLAVMVLLRCGDVPLLCSLCVCEVMCASEADGLVMLWQPRSHRRVFLSTAEHKYLTTFIKSVRPVLTSDAYGCVFTTKNGMPFAPKTMTEHISVCWDHLTTGVELKALWQSLQENKKVETSNKEK